MIQFIPIITAALFGGVLWRTKGFGLWQRDENGEKVLKKKLAVLGPSNSGKTVFFSFLKGEKLPQNNNSTPITGEEFKTIIITHGDKKIILKSTIDAPGSESSLKTHYKKLLDECSDVFFFFDCYEFFNNQVYKDTTMSMIDYVIRHNKHKRKIIFLGTHADVLLLKNDSIKSRKKASGELAEELLKEFNYEKIGKIELINMMKKEEIEILKLNLFK
jgi:GTPase SAR1 family protein